MRVVSPYRPFAPEIHHQFSDFDWVEALQLLTSSVCKSNNCATHALTDWDTALPVPSFQYATKERRLMLWILEVSLCYLMSKDFDCDTVMISPDTLVYKDIKQYFTADLGLVIRPDKFNPLLNSVQWWSHAAKKKLTAFYAKVLATAKRLPEKQKVWGADTTAILNFVKPLASGVTQREGLSVAMFLADDVLQSIGAKDIAILERGGTLCPKPTPMVDFRYTRKWHMRAYYDATLGAS